MAALLKYRRILLWPAAAFLIVILLGLTVTLGTVPSTPSQSGRAKIDWAPNPLITSISAGASNTVLISLTTTEDVNNVVLWTVPELQPFISISPSSLPEAKAGQPIQVKVTVAAPATTLPQMISGTIHVRGTNNKTISAPLPVTIDVQWQRLSDDSLGFSLSYPAAYVPSFLTGSNLQQIVFSENEHSYDGGIAPVLIVMTLSLPLGHSVRDWIHSFGVSDTNIEEVAIGERSYLKWFESDGLGDQGAISYSTAVPNNKVLTFVVSSQSLASSPALTLLISSLTFMMP